MRHLIRVTVAMAALIPTLVMAQATVIPSDRVVTGVSIRESATTNAPRRGLLRPGEVAEFMGEVSSCYRINHPTVGLGFVSKSWTVLRTVDEDDGDAEFDIYAIDVGTGRAIYLQGEDFNLD